VKKILIGVAGIVIGLAIGFMYGHMQLAGTEKVYAAKLKEMNQRLSQAQRKFVEERTQHTSLEDDKQAVQSQLEALQKEKESLAAQNREFKAKIETTEARAASLDKKIPPLEARATSLDSKNAQLSERLAKVEAERAALDRKQQQTFQTLQEREKELRQTSADSRKQYEQCAEHNARLYTIADELVRQYEGKGVMKTLLTKEPFTQIKKVEMEKLVQDYKEQIDQQKITSKTR
jgi:chromosome segregation ATPase